MRSRSLGTLSVSALAGASVWALSGWLYESEPWDVTGPFYVIALVIAGSLAGLIAPRPLWAHYIGAVAGQLIYELAFLKLGSLVVLGVVFLLGFSLIFLAAAAVGALLGVRIRRARMRQEAPG
jgi:hypothetical protein